MLRSFAAEFSVVTQHYEEDRYGKFNLLGRCCCDPKSWMEVVCSRTSCLHSSLAGLSSLEKHTFGDRYRTHTLFNTSMCKQASKDQPTLSCLEMLFTAKGSRPHQENSAIDSQAEVQRANLTHGDWKRFEVSTAADLPVYGSTREYNSDQHAFINEIQPWSLPAVPRTGTHLVQATALTDSCSTTSSQWSTATDHVGMIFNTDSARVYNYATYGQPTYVQQASIVGEEPTQLSGTALLV